MCSYNSWPALCPRTNLLKLSGKAEQRRLVAIVCYKLYPDRKFTAGLGQWQAYGRLPGGIEEGREWFHIRKVFVEPGKRVHSWVILVEVSQWLRQCSHCRCQQYIIIADIVLPVIAILLCGATIYSTIIPVPPPSLNLAPYIVAVWLLLGLILLAVLWFTNREQVTSSAGRSLNKREKVKTNGSPRAVDVRTPVPFLPAHDIKTFQII
jgi:hypothetical protein